MVFSDCDYAEEFEIPLNLIKKILKVFVVFKNSQSAGETFIKIVLRRCRTMSKSQFILTKGNQNIRSGRYFEGT